MSKGFLYDTGDELITREDVNEVPDGSTSSAGDVLSLDSNKKPKWTTPESGLPDTSEASAGDVLALDEDKEPVWSAPSGGGGGGFVISVDISAEPISLDEYYSGFPTNKTWNDVKEAIESGIIPSIVVSGEAEAIPTFVMFLDNEGPSGYAYHGGLLSANAPGTILSAAFLAASTVDGTMYYAFEKQN